MVTFSKNHKERDMAKVKANKDFLIARAMILGSSLTVISAIYFSIRGFV